MSGIRKLAAEAVDNGMLAPERAQGISRVKIMKLDWHSHRPSQRQAQALLSERPA
jgi:hypothetical protein